MLKVKDLNKEFVQNIKDTRNIKNVKDIKNIQKTKNVWAVRNVELSVDSGEFIGIVGYSGSGKTTLLNLIAGLLNPTSGQILLNGKNIVNLSDKEISIVRNTEIGYIMQGNSILSNLTVLDNVCLPYNLFLRSRKDDVKSYAEELLEKVGIIELKNSFPANLSGGELKRVAIVRAMINHPILLLADEPTSDLDMENTLEIIKLFRSIANQGTAVIMVTHDRETLKFCNNVYEMNAGNLKNI